MKFKTLFAAAALVGTMSSFASCFDTYQDQRKDVENFISNSNLKQASIEGLALASTTNVIVISALSGGVGGPLVSTAAGAGLITSLYLADAYINMRVEDGVEEAMAKRYLLESSLALLREAKLGNGPLLQDAIVGINRTVSTEISLKDLADKINDQSNNRLYCQNPEVVMSPAGILNSAIDSLKANL